MNIHVRYAKNSGISTHQVTTTAEKQHWYVCAHSRVEILRKLSHVKIEAHGMVMVSEIEALPPIEAPLQ